MDHIEFNGAIENLWHVFGSLNESMSKLSWERQFFYYRTSLYFEVTKIHILVNMFLGILKYFQRDFFQIHRLLEVLKAVFQYLFLTLV